MESRKNRPPQSDFRKTIEAVAASKSSPLSVFQDFVRLVACSVAARVPSETDPTGSISLREAEYLEVVKRYTRTELDQLARAMVALSAEMEDKPFQDVLGPYYLEIGARSTQEARGEFYTPQALSEMIARMLIDVEAIIAEGKSITVQEPACGAGGMILSLAQQFAPKEPDAPSHVDLLRVTAIDVNPMACDMTFINTTMWGIPTQVIWGNTLKWEIHQVWSNLHWFRVGQHEIDRMRTLWEQVESVIERPIDSKPKASDLTLPPDPVATEQLDLFDGES